VISISFRRLRLSVIQPIFQNAKPQAAWIAWLAFFAIASPNLLHADSPLDASRSFLKQHCFECHGPKKQANNLRFDTLGNDLAKKAEAEVWQGILDQLNAGTMPPKGKPRPDAKEAASVIQLLTTQLKEAYAKSSSTGGKTLLRRLNRLEFRNTLRDLLFLEGTADFQPDVMVKLEDRNGDGVARWSSNDPTREFPADELEGGLDTIGGRLVMSDFLLTKIISAAEYSLDLATYSGKAPSFEPKRFVAPISTGGNGGWAVWSREVDPSFDGIYQRYREPGAAAGGMGCITSNKLSTGVGITGRYRITIEASAHNQRHPWGDVIKSKQDEPMLLGLHIVDAPGGGLGENHRSILVKQWELAGDGNKHVLQFELTMDGKWLPWIGWENAPYERSLTPSKLVQKVLPNAYKPPPGKGSTEKERQQYEPAMARALFKAGYSGPHLRIYNLTVEPLEKSWPPKRHVALYGENDNVPVEDLILRFAERAFRKSVKPDEVARYVKLVDAQQKKGRSRAEALRAGYTAMIASPRFYYFSEAEGPLDGLALASRLSYFLWSSMPDDELLSLAKTDALKEPAVLRKQIDRMLDDPKSRSFVRRFTARWLHLDKLGTMPPPGGFYFHRNMEAEMLKQTDAFFADLIKTNGPIRNIIDSDYTFLNERVAHWIYHRDDVWGDGFRKVPAKAPHGGGMLTMPGIMTATANGVDTSPVVRGVWVLESILGTPPSPPPPDVEPLSPDLRKARTIREQLEAHRKQESCRSCHQKIDPFGFPFENFNELGLWRTVYKDSGKALKIDPSAIFADGTRAADISELRKILLKREDQITRNLAERLLAYASGRMVERVDRGEVDRIVSASMQQGNGLRDLIKLVAESRIFRTK